MRIRNIQPTTSYHLAIVLLSYTNAAGDSSRKRLNLLEEAYSDVSARVQAQPKPDPDTLESLQGIGSELGALRDAYEPIIDLDPIAYSKLAAFEGTLGEIRTRLMILIERENLVSRDDLSEAMVSPVMMMGGRA